MGIKKDWTGYKFNTFTVLGEDLNYRKECEEKIAKGLLKRYNIKYLCRCECGNIVSLSSTQIAKNKPLSCGCKQILTAEDLTGKQFGDWTVLHRDIEYASTHKLSKARWICKCKCGSIKSVMGEHLKDGRSRGCGCARNEQSGLRMSKDISGQKFGKLTAIEKIRMEKKSNSIWRCVCECGEEIEAGIYDLTSGRISSCKSCHLNGFDSIEVKRVYEISQSKINREGSLGSFIEEKYPDIDLSSIWSKDNRFTPYEYTRKSHQDIYLICPKCHKRYKTSGLELYERVYEPICQSCMRDQRDSSYEFAVKHFLNEEKHIKTLHESECNLRPVNPKTGSRLYYDNELPEQKIIIEVHGRQHYEALDARSKWLDGKSPEDWLKDLQERDEYKKQYAIAHGYKYLAISYLDVTNNLFKKKIEEIIEVSKN